MRKLINIKLLLLILILIACEKRQSTFADMLNSIEKLMIKNPDSASVLLTGISPEELDNETFARWCLLSGEAMLKLNHGALTIMQNEQALDWYNKHGTPEERVKITLYLGKAHAEINECDKAMQTYTEAYEMALQYRLIDVAGYVSSCMGDLYGQQDLLDKAVEKYKIASEYFKTANNKRSYFCALRDMGREYFLMDSLSMALATILKADSIVAQLNDKALSSTIYNLLGNIELSKGEYDKSEKSFLHAIELGQNEMCNHWALVNFYIETEDFVKARDFLQKMPLDNSELSYPLNEAYYQLYKAEGNYQKALEKLEVCSDLVDSVVFTENKSKVLEIETKYNNLKIQTENEKLKNTQLEYIILAIVSICCALLILLLYILHKKRMREKIHKQVAELNEAKLTLQTLSLELEKKKNQLALSAQLGEGIDQLQGEVEELSQRYRNLQRNMLLRSSIYLKLLHLTRQNIPRNDKSLITEELWQLLIDEVTVVYPTLKSFVLTLCPDMNEQEWKYCCFYMYGFDGNDEAKLLNLTLNSVRTKHVRFRQRLNVTLSSKMTLYEYLILNIN